MLMILAVGFQESYVQGFVNLTQVRDAAEVEGVVVTLVVHLCD